MIAAAVVLFAATGNIIPALTLLVIACPGALVIATPVAVAASIGRAARGGLMIRGGERLEAIGRTTAVVLDKTGTLTKGQPEVAEVIPSTACRAKPMSFAGRRSRSPTPRIRWPARSWLPRGRRQRSDGGLRRGRRRDGHPRAISVA
jgi:P-type E1-E2 ATPase